MPAPHHSIFTDWMLFLMPKQECQSTEINSKMIPDRIWCCS